MRIYISAFNIPSIRKIKSLDEGFNPNVLKAYELDKTKSNNELIELLENRNLYNSLMVDSGTFVANAGRLVDSKDFNEIESFKEYASFIASFKENIDFYVNYDVLFSGEDSFAVNNSYQKLMEEYGLNPIFVMHSFNDYEIEYILNKKPRLVAIASAMLKPSQFKEAIKIIDIFYKEDIKVHLLGCGSYKNLCKTKAWSADASSYGQYASAGQLNYFTNIESTVVDENGIKHRICKGETRLSLSRTTDSGKINFNFYDAPYMQEYRMEYENFIYEKLGIGLHEIIADSTLVVLSNAYHMYCMEKKVTEFQKANGVNFNVW